jgi:hypothetical protein
MAKLPSLKVQRVAAHLSYYLAKGFSENEASALLAKDFGLVPQNTQEAAFRYARNAALVYDTQDVFPTSSTIDQLYGGAENIPSGRMGLRVLANYVNDNGETFRTASKVVSVSGDSTIQEAFDVAEHLLRGTDSLPSTGEISFSILSSVPFPPQSEQ